MLRNSFYILLFTLVSWGGYLISYPSNTPLDLYYDGIFLEKITNHIKEISKHPRAIGDYHHGIARIYLTNQLSRSGLTVRKQKSTVYSRANKNAAPVENIIATYEGTQPDAPTLVLMAHYDAAEFNSTGAADDASGVAVILEVVHAYLQSGQRPENNLMVLLTDAEEVGLLGAQAFIREQLMNHNIKLIINLEARGSGGPVMMWPETVSGNKGLIQAFAAADVPLPVTTSLHYEIYRLLPNDTDLTPFNQQAGIDGFNLAFIDHHFNYHTRQDTLANLSPDTLAHQVIQLKSLLSHFANTDLNQLTSEDSLIYFNLPGLGLVTYDTHLNYVLWLLTFCLWLYGLWRKPGPGTSRKTGWLAAGLGVLLISAGVFLLTWSVLFVIRQVFPGHADILQGFPYQGHAMMFGCLLSGALLATAGWGHRHSHLRQITQLLQGLWLTLMAVLMYHMPGSGFLIWPVLGSALGLVVWHHSPRWGEQLLLILLLLSGWLLGSVLINLPIALGVAMLPATACILTLLLGLYSPVFHPSGSQWRVLLSCCVPLALMSWAMFQNRHFTPNTAHPTSLSYLYNTDTNEGVYFNYDSINSGWNEFMFTGTASAEDLRQFRQAHKKPVRQLHRLADPITLQPIKAEVNRPLVQTGNQRLNIELTAHRNSKLIEIYSKSAMRVHQLTIEDRIHVFDEPLQIASGQRLLRYYFSGKKQLKIELITDPDESLNWLIQTHSVDLLQDDRFDIQPRPAHQMPKPFISTDNLIIEQSLASGFDQ